MAAIMDSDTVLALTCRDLSNSRFGVSYSNFSFLTPTFWKVSIDKYGKTPTFSGGQHFTPIFKILVRTLIKGSLGVRDSQKLSWDFQKSMPGSLGLTTFKYI